MPSDLCTPADVVNLLLRPLTSQESQYVPNLIVQASALLRNAAPSVDARMGRWSPGGTDRTSVDPAVVSSVVAGMITRYIRNPEGYASKSAGPFTVAFALRSEKTERGVLEVTVSDLRALFPNRKRLRAGIIRTRPGLAPRPVGRYGPVPSVTEAVDAIIEWSPTTPVAGGEYLGFVHGTEGPL